MEELKSFGEFLSLIGANKINDNQTNDSGFEIPPKTEVDVSSPIRKFFAKLGLAKRIIKTFTAEELIYYMNQQKIKPVIVKVDIEQEESKV
jgi:hypothetical protein